MLGTRLKLASLASLWVAAACVDNIGPKIGVCKPADGFALTLAVGEFFTVNPSVDSACVRFEANLTPDTREYLVLPQSATGVPGRTASFLLSGDTLAVAMMAAVAASPGAGGGDIPPAERFHTFLREGDESRWRGFAPQIVGEGPAPSRAPAAPAARPVYGAQRSFQVCATLTCSSFEQVTATARAVKTNVAIYVDNDAPSGGLDSLALDSLATMFDTRLYPVDTAAFGVESDINADSVVLVLMTPVVNQLVASEDCATDGFVAGFFLGIDIDPLFRTDPRSNKSEVFYTFVADPAGSVSCAHDVASVKRFVPVTLVHEFQHMISYNQHVLLRGGAAEALWLNEGFSHYAEELGGRSFLQGGTPEDTAAFSRFAIGNLSNAYKYLDATGNHFLLASAGIGSLPERGAEWLFVRYLVDRYAGDTTVAAWNTFTRSLVETSLTGAENIAAETGDPFVDVVTRWGLANWVSDLPSFTAPAELRYTSWSFRTTYASLNAQQPSSFPKPFPLVPTTSDADTVQLTGMLRAGSGVYHRAFQAPGAGPFALRFISPTGFLLPANRVPRLSIIRIR